MNFIRRAAFSRVSALKGVTVNESNSNSFLAKASLMTILVGFGLFAMAMIFHQHEAGGGIFFMTLILSLICGIYSRKHPISRVTLMIDVILIVIAVFGVVAKVLSSSLLATV